jgi:hypothetical protein
MTRYINLCREPPKPTPPQDKPPKQEESISKYEKYKESYELYRNLEGRKEFHKNYNKNYRLKHSFLVECECGTTHKSISRYAHVKSQHHIAYFQKQNNENKQDE